MDAADALAEVRREGGHALLLRRGVRRDGREVIVCGRRRRGAAGQPKEAMEEHRRLRRALRLSRASHTTALRLRCALCALARVAERTKKEATIPRPAARETPEPSGTVRARHAKPALKNTARALRIKAARRALSRRRRTDQ